MIEEVVEQYLTIFPEDRAKLQRLLKQLKDNEFLDDRNNFHGHIAGDAVIFSPDHQKILLIFHKRYGKWQQPGGHWDKGEEDPWLTAQREAAEETGISNLARVNLVPDYRIPLHIVTGMVPASTAKSEPRHWHHDFRYGFVATSEGLSQVKDQGISGVKWQKLDELKTEGVHNLQTSVRRMQRLLKA